MTYLERHDSQLIHTVIAYAALDNLSEEFDSMPSLTGGHCFLVKIQTNLE